jgi:Putative zinc-finger
MKCQELLAMLNEYVDGAMDPSVCAEFNQHLAGCNPCKIVVDNIRKTISVYKHGRPYEIPLKFHTRLHDALRMKWMEKHPGP